MTLSDVNDAASTKSGLDRTRSDHLVFGFGQNFKLVFQIFSGLSSI